MLYTAKCFWPAAGESEIRLAAARASCEAAQHDASFRGALYLPDNELVLCLFEAMSPSSVKSESESAGMPCERVMETVWIAPGREGQPERSKR
jgi:uncharacterized protein DUF4242